MGGRDVMAELHMTFNSLTCAAAAAATAAVVCSTC